MHAGDDHNSTFLKPAAAGYVKLPRVISPLAKFRQALNRVELKPIGF